MAKEQRIRIQAVRRKAAETNWKEEVLRKFADAASQNDCGLINFDGMPEWAWKAFFECFKVIFPGGLPPMGEWNAEQVGVFLGRLYGLERLYSGEVPLGVETKGEMDRLKQMVEKQPPPKNLRAIEKDFETQFEAVHKTIPAAIAMAGASTYSDARDFQKGLARGMRIEPDELATSRKFQRHTRTFWVLAVFWRYWVNCRSVHEIYQRLCREIGEKKIGSFKTFENHVAKKIGLKVRGRGRPRAT